MRKLFVLALVLLLATAMGCPAKSKKGGPGSQAGGDMSSTSSTKDGPGGADTGGIDTGADAVDQGKVAISDDTGTGMAQQDDSPAGIFVGGTSPVNDIYFSYDKYDLDDTSKAVLKQLADKLRGSSKVLIEGHCDERGTNEYNIALGDRRAASAKNYLMALGVSSSKIVTLSYGEEKPACTGSTESCWSKNRRDHFIVKDFN